MILADKIILLRKRSGWSQEELAEKMGVTRQSVSKWEGAQSVPDLEKILRMSQLFGVSTDYLLKDEMEEAETLAVADDGEGPRRVSMEEASEFLRLRAEAAGRIARATVLCILSPLCLFLLAAASETGALPLSENAAAGLGLLVLFLMVAMAVEIFITTGSKSAPYEFLEKEVFETAYGVEGMVRQRREELRERYTRGNVRGACLCILAVIPLVCGGLLWDNELFMVGMLCVMLLMVAAGVYSFITVGVPWAAMEKLLQEGDYTRAQKRQNARVGAIYWPLAAAVYLGWSFLSGNWHITWVVWPVAGVLYAAVAAVFGALGGKRQ